MAVESVHFFYTCALMTPPSILKFEDLHAYAPLDSHPLDGNILFSNCTTAE